MMRNVHEFTYALMHGHSKRKLIGGHPNVGLSISKPTVNGQQPFYNYNWGLADHKDDVKKALAGKTHDQYLIKTCKRFF